MSNNSVRVFLVGDTLKNQKKYGWTLVPLAGTDIRSLCSGQAKVGHGFRADNVGYLGIWMSESPSFPEFEATVNSDSNLIVVVHSEPVDKGPEWVIPGKGIKLIFEQYLEGAGYVGVFKQTHHCQWQIGWSAHSDGKGRVFTIFNSDESEIGFKVNLMLTTI